MKDVLNVEQVRKSEAFTMRAKGISEVELMKIAGDKITGDFLKRVKPDSKSNIFVLAGIGNNGGDSLVVYYNLLKLGFKTRLMIIGDRKEASPSFQHYFQEEEPFMDIISKDDIYVFKNDILESDIIIDGIFGIGLHRNVEGLHKEVIDIVNTSLKTVYSIDIPSGISPENGIVLNIAIKANYTGVLGFIKTGTLLNDALDYNGEWEVLDIGLVCENTPNIKYFDVDEINIAPKHRYHNSHKYSYGFGMFFGGEKTMMGAIQMSAISALKSGMGIARIVYEEQGVHFTKFYPELIYQGIENYKQVDDLLNKANSIVYGPGMGRRSSLFNQILDNLIDRDIPMLIDAGGLSYINVDQMPKNKYIILTPHLGEIARMFSVTALDISKDPFTYIKKLTDLNYTVLLKGPATIIANKKSTFIGQAKNPGLAKAGSGDVLSGIICAYMNNNLPIEACIKGFSLHAKASNLAKENKSLYSMLPSDIIESISEVFKEKL